MDTLEDSCENLDEEGIDLKPSSADILRAVDATGETVIDFLREIVRVDSSVVPERNWGKEKECQLLVQEELERIGLETHVWDPDPRDLTRLVPSLAMFDCRDRPNVVGVWKGEGGSGHSLILNAHIDTVPVNDVDQWQHDPWGAEIEHGKVFGRGTADDKGGVAAIIGAVKVLRELSVGINSDLIMEIVMGEEQGGIGTAACIAQGFQAEAGIVVEPTGCRQFDRLSRGSLWWRIQTIGKSAHSSVFFRGVSAVESMCRVVGALDEYRRVRDREKRHPLEPKEYLVAPALCIGSIRGGSDPATVPSSCILEGNMELEPGESVDKAFGELRDYLDRFSVSDPIMKEYPPKIEQWGLRLEPYEVDGSHPIVNTMRNSIRVSTGEEAAVKFGTGPCDANLLNFQGRTPAIVYGPGPGESGQEVSHTRDEHVDVQELIASTKVLALAVANWCT